MTFDESKQQRHTVVEQGTSFRGTLSSTCPIDVHGSIEGEVETPALAVSASGKVHGRARVGSVTSDGELSGEFDADSVELAGRVRDNTVIRARSLYVRLATDRGKLQVVFGECELAIGDEPAERAQVSSTPEVAPVIEAHSVLAIEPAPVAEIVEPVAAASPAEPAVKSTSTPPVAASLAESADIFAAEPAATATASASAAPAAVEASASESDDDLPKLRNGDRKKAWSQRPSQPPPS